MTRNSEISVASQQKSVEKALKSQNPMESLSQYSKYLNGDFEVTLYCKTKNDMNPKTLKWAFKLAEANVGPYYKTCSMGWQPKIKQSDLNKSWARYLVAVDKMKNPVAYAMFRFDMDYGSSVLYWYIENDLSIQYFKIIMSIIHICMYNFSYEMQIEKSSQRKGLGKFMMIALEECAKYWGMEKIILTVLKNNKDGMEFFIKLGFSVDETSPDKSEKADYEILSKKLL